MYIYPSEYKYLYVLYIFSGVLLFTKCQTNDFLKKRKITEFHENFCMK